MTGNEYRSAVAAYLATEYQPRGLMVHEEVPFGRTVLGKGRRVDILAVSGSHMVAIETKYQESSGTAEEKIPHALDDAAKMDIVCGVVYGGNGWSAGVRDLLRRRAYHCDPVSGKTGDLDYFIAVSFGWPEVILRGSTPILIE